ncbi:MAG: hypothetical protein M1823_004883 [Watsoniomyces obsoletus]|nr:MAG: hypothetical protein M1823_004883 [Watsoniomyces obsoletus]
MAFQQRPQPVIQRRSSERQEIHPSSRQEVDEPREDPQQEWVLFSPAVPSTVEVLTASINEAADEEVGSHLSVVESGFSLVEQEEQSKRNEDGLISGQLDDDLDSLDSHLHAFRDIVPQFPSHHDYNYMALLPTHNGLGSFLATSGQPPARTNKDELGMKRKDDQDPEESEVETARTARIQAWRLEQSVLLQEALQGPVGRRKEEKGAGSRSKTAGGSNSKEESTEAVVTNENSSVVKKVKENRDSKFEEVQVKDAAESILDRITRRVLKDVLQIDEPLLSIILGEELVHDSHAHALSALPDYGAPPEKDQGMVMTHQSGWLDRLLERLTRELGFFMHHLTEHPGAFSVYPRHVQTGSILGRYPPASFPSVYEKSSIASRRLSFGTQPSGTPQFRPSIPLESPRTKRHAPYNNNDRISISSSVRHRAEVLDFEDEQLKSEQAYWERELGVTVVFSFLRDRFRRRRHPPPPNTVSSPAHPHQHPSSTIRTRAPPTLRHHHPLIPLQSRRSERSLHLHLASSTPNNNANINNNNPYFPSYPVGATPLHQQILLKRPSSSSCGASQSTKSKRTKSLISTDHHGHHYHDDNENESGNFWDFGGSHSHSMGSISLALPTTPRSTSTTNGPLGYWGEV